jgi:nucleoside-diphosphate-sugar epimerase
MTGRLFLTGATGGLGRKLLPALLESGCEVSALCRGPAARLPAGVRLVAGDLLASATYEEALSGIDTVLHLAAVTHTNRTRDYFRVNTEGTRLLLEAAERRAVSRFVFVSTRAVAEEGGPYCRSKKLAEDLVRAGGTAWTILRPAEVYGVEDREAVGALIGWIERLPFVPLIGSGAYSMAPVHVDDVCAAIVKVLETPATEGRTYTLAGPEEFSYRAFVARVMAARGIRKPVVRVPVVAVRAAAALFALAGLRRPPLVRDQVARLLSPKDADIANARRDLGYDPKPFDPS